MLRRLAGWHGSRIAALWAALVVLEGGVALAINVRGGPLPNTVQREGSRSAYANDRARGVNHSLLPPKLEATLVAVESRSSQDSQRAGGFQTFVDSFAAPVWQSVTDTFLDPQFLFLLAAIAVFFYGLPLAVLALTVLWIVARRRHVPSRTHEG